MIHLTVQIRADDADELADAFAYLATNGLRLEATAPDAAERVSRSPVATVTDLVDRRRREGAHA